MCAPKQTWTIKITTLNIFLFHFDFLHKEYIDILQIITFMDEREFNILRSQIYQYELLYEIVLNLAYTNIKYKSIDTDKKCVIALENIKSGDLYYECYVCNNVFSNIGFEKWFRHNFINNNPTKCPMCRIEYFTLPDLYVNYCNYRYLLGATFIIFNFFILGYFVRRLFFIIFY